MGRSVIEQLQERQFPCTHLLPFDGEEHYADSVVFNNKSLPVDARENLRFEGVDLLINVAEKLNDLERQAAQHAGTAVIELDCGAEDEADVPLMVASLHQQALKSLGKGAFVRSPTTIALALALALEPLHKEVGVAAASVVALQCVAASGKKGVEELAGQTARLLNGQAVKAATFDQQIAFNLLAGVGTADEQGETFVERSTRAQLREMMALPNLPVNLSVLPVPVFYADSCVVSVELEEQLSAEHAAQLLAKIKAIKLMPASNIAQAPSPVGSDERPAMVEIGRVRENPSSDCGLNLWLVADNAKKGAALNCVQIAEYLIKSYL